MEYRNLIDLPNELLVVIFSKLSRDDLDRAARVCDRFRNLIATDIVLVRIKRPIFLTLTRGLVDVMLVTSGHRTLRITETSESMPFANSIVKTLMMTAGDPFLFFDELKIYKRLGKATIPVETMTVVMRNFGSIVRMRRLLEQFPTNIPSKSILVEFASDFEYLKSHTF